MPTEATTAPRKADDIRRLVGEFLATCDPATVPPAEFLRARFDAGLAWVHFPAGLGGLGAPRALQTVADAEFAAAGAPTNHPERIRIGLAMAAPTNPAFRTGAHRTPRPPPPSTRPQSSRHLCRKPPPR